MLKKSRNKEFFDELDSAGPNPKLYDHDDQWDAASSGFNYLAGGQQEMGYMSVKQALQDGGFMIDERKPEDRPQRGFAKSRRFGPGAW